MQQGKPNGDTVPCPSCGGEMEWGVSECPHCGSMAPLRISADPKSLVKQLAKILTIIAVGLILKLFLMG